MQLLKSTNSPRINRICREMLPKRKPHYHHQSGGDSTDFLLLLWLSEWAALSSIPLSKLRKGKKVSWTAGKRHAVGFKEPLSLRTHCGHAENLDYLKIKSGLSGHHVDLRHSPSYRNNKNYYNNDDCNNNINLLKLGPMDFHIKD